MKRLMYLSILIVLLLKFDQISSTNVHVNNNIESQTEYIDKKLNALGQKTAHPVVLSTFPMTVKSCDNIAIFKAKYIKDLNEYREREVGWFTVSAYTINLYKSKDADKLIHSVQFANLKTKPMILKGARSCIRIDGGAVSADITICFEDKMSADNLLNVIETFYQCRRGDDLQPIPANLVKKLLQLTGEKGLEKFNKSGKPLSKTESNPRAGNKWDADRMRYYHPNGIKVPGTL